jgi:hypothetical protein
MTACKFGINTRTLPSPSFNRTHCPCRQVILLSTPYGIHIAHMVRPDIAGVSSYPGVFLSLSMTVVQQWDSASQFGADPCFAND